MIVIENGCIELSNAINLWRYDWEDSTGSYSFTFVSDVRPKIGDSIDTEAGVLVPLVGYRINNDPGKAQGKQLEDQEWPSRIRSQ